MISLLVLAAGLARGAEPATLGLVAEPPAVLDAYKRAAEAKGRSGSATRMDCRPAFDEVLFCLTKLEEGGWRYATAADLETDGLTSAQAHSAAATYLRSLPLQERITAQTVEGMSGTYWSGRLDDGRDVAPLLLPQALQTSLGGQVVVAIPAQGAFVAWVPGDPALDKVVAVGVRKMFDQAGHPISPKLYTWGKDGWEVWAEVVKP